MEKLAMSVQNRQYLWNGWKQGESYY